MKLFRRIAAIAVAMTMAVSMMAVSASANSANDYNEYVKVSGTTNLGTRSGSAYTKATNLTTIVRYMVAQVNIYNDKDVYQTQAYKFANAGYNGTVTSGDAADVAADCYYAICSGVLYHSQDTTQGGQFPGISIRVNF